MVSVNIADTVSVSRRKDKHITVRMRGESGAAIDVHEKENSAYRAASALCRGFDLGGLDIEIIKGIPFSAGLGGSSADAAGVIAAAARLYNIDVKSSSAYIIAFKSGSDVPFMLEGGFAHATGRGEKVECFNAAAPLHMVIAKGKNGCATKDSYGKFDELNKWKKGGSKALIGALKQGDIASAAAGLYNDLQAPSFLLCPEIQTTLELLKGTNPLNCIMTGSGSACFGLYGSAEQAETAAKALEGKLDFVRAVKTTGSSIEFL